MRNIPKQLHLYWDGSNMSQLQTFTVTTFHRLNSDWNITIYMPKIIYNGPMKFGFIPDYTGPDYFHTLKKLDYVTITTIDLDDYNIGRDLHGILRSDIFRYHILYEVGGVWTDFDVFWVKSMEHFNTIKYYGEGPINEANAVVSFIHGTGGGHSIGIMIHAKNDPYARALMEATKKVEPPFTHEKFGGDMLNKYYPTLESLQQFGNVVGVHFETYYPYNIHPPNTTIQKLYHSTDLTCINSNVMCVHWYNGRRESKYYVNNDGFNTKCSMTILLKSEGYI